MTNSFSKQLANPDSQNSDSKILKDKIEFLDFINNLDANSFNQSNLPPEITKEEYIKSLAVLKSTSVNLIIDRYNAFKTNKQNDINNGLINNEMAVISNKSAVSSSNLNNNNTFNNLDRYDNILLQNKISHEKTVYMSSKANKHHLPQQQNNRSY